MKNNDFFSRAFGKDKDPQTHARVMLIIYGIFITAVILAVRLNPNRKVNTRNKPNGGEIVEKTPAPTATPEPTSDPTATPTPTPSSSPKQKKTNDIKYAYSYTINYDDKTEVYLGKKIDDKEKFSYIKDGKTLEYAIIDDQYLIKTDSGVYHIIDKLNNYFKYCDAEKILVLLEDKIKTSTNQKHTVTNEELAKAFGEEASGPKLENTIELVIVDDELKEINMDLSNYKIDLKKFTIKMEFADIGKVEDFEIKMN